LANGDPHAEGSPSARSEHHDFEDFIKDQVRRHDEALAAMDSSPRSSPSQAALDLATRDSLSRPLQALASKSLAVVLELKLKEEQLRESRECLHIERTRREVFDLQLAERNQQLQKAQDLSRRSEESFKKAKRQQEEASRRIESQFRESELRLERRHEQDSRLRGELEERLDALRATESQLRERLRQERKAREAAEAAQRNMLQRHLAMQPTVKSPALPILEGGGEAGAAASHAALSLGYSLDSVSEITRVNHNLLLGEERADGGHMDKERIRSLELELVERDQELAKARLSLKRVEHHKEKLIRENEEMMETLGFSFPEELASSPNRVQPARGREGATHSNNLGAISVMMSEATTIAAAVERSIAESFEAYHVHLDGVLAEVASAAAAAPASPAGRAVLVSKLGESTREQCRLAVQQSVTKVLLEILEDDRPLILGGQAHSTLALFERVSEELVRTRAELEAGAELRAQQETQRKLFEDLSDALESSQRDLERANARLVANGSASGSDARVKKLEQTIGRLRNENMALASQRDGANKVKRILEKKISGLLEKDLRMQRELEERGKRASPPRERGGYFGDQIPKDGGSGREQALRNMLLERVNSSLAAVATARDGDASSPAPRGEDPALENWQAISDFTSRLSEDGETPSKRPSPPPPFPAAAPPASPRPASASPRKAPPPAFEAAIAAASSTPAPPARPAAALSPTAFSSQTKDALFRLNKLGRPNWSGSHVGWTPERPMAARQVGQDAQRSPLGYLPFVRHTDDALDYALKSTAAGIHRRLSQARQIREEMIHDQVYPGANAGASIVPPSPHISHLASARDLHDRVSETSGEFGGELAKLKKEVARYKRQMVKAEKEAIKARSDLNEVVDELMEVKSTTATPVAQEGRRRGPRHQRM